MPVNEPKFIKLSLVLPDDVLFGSEPDELVYFELGWQMRVLSGPWSVLPEGRAHVPEASQNCRISWERGWLAANAAVNRLM